jgi:hypothetical protein
MEHYVGLDVSLRLTSICVVKQTGSIVQEGVEAIASFVRLKAPGTVRIGIETGPTTTWLWTELNRLRLPVICIDARHAKAVLKMQINKRPQRCGQHSLHHADRLVQGGTPRTSTATRSERCWRAGHQPVNLTVEIADLLLDVLARLEQRPDRSHELGTILDQLLGSRGEDIELGATDEEPRFLSGPRTWFSRSRLILTSNGP